MKALLILFIVFHPFCSFAQADTTINYFDSSWTQLKTGANAVYKAKTWMDDGAWQRRVFRTSDGYIVQQFFFEEDITHRIKDETWFFPGTSQPSSVTNYQEYLP